MSPGNAHEQADVAWQDRTPDELIHLICKLRWMGMEDEATAVETQLAACGVLPADNVIACPRDTD